MRFIHNWVIRDIRWMIHWFIVAPLGEEIWRAWIEPASGRTNYLDSLAFVVRTCTYVTGICTFAFFSLYLSSFLYQQGVCHIVALPFASKSSTVVWPVPLAQVLPCPQLIFPSKIWFFLDFFWNFQLLNSLLNQYLPHFLNPNLIK